MANTTSNVSVGKPAVSGGIWRAPLGTTLPTDATTALAADYKCLGYISDAGVTNTLAVSSENIRAWGGDVVLNYQTEKTDTFAFSMIESTNVEVLKTVYGDANVSGTLASGITVHAKGTELPESVYVVEYVLRNGNYKRIVIPDGKISALGDIVYQDNAAIAYPVTITCMTGSDGDTHKEYIAEAPASSN